MSSGKDSLQHPERQLLYAETINQRQKHTAKFQCRPVSLSLDRYSLGIITPHTSPCQTQTSLQAYIARPEKREPGNRTIKIVGYPACCRYACHSEGQTSGNRASCRRNKTAPACYEGRFCHGIDVPWRKI